MNLAESIYANLVTVTDLSKAKDQELRELALKAIHAAQIYRLEAIRAAQIYQEVQDVV